MRIINTAPEQPARGFIAQWLQQHAARPVVVLASGGSAAPVLADAWRQLSVTEQTNVVFSLVDERYGSPGHADSNWALLQSTGIDLADQRHRPVLQVGESMQTVTDKWDQWLSGLFTSAVPVVAILGIGDDSHIAGLKPDCPALHSNRLAACYEWTDYQRITLTPSGLSQLTSSVVYARGEAKRLAIDLLDTDQDTDHYPSQLLKQLRDCTVYYEQ